MIVGVSISGMSGTRLRIAVIATNRTHAGIIEAGLCDVGAEALVILHDPSQARAKIAETDPDVVVIDLETEDDALFGDMLEMTRTLRKPVAMFVDHADQAMISAATEAGVGAFVTDGMKAERVKPIVELAISRFRTFERLSKDLNAARAELADRKRIDQAKGILISNRGLSEAEAYGLLRRTAMSQNRKIAEVADTLISASCLLDGPTTKK